jgi:HSP20 family molecular chaperone IbpA
MSAQAEPRSNERAMTKRQETSPAPHQEQEPARARRVPFACDIYENDDEYLILADLPGVSTERLEAMVHGDRLSVRGTRTTQDVDLTYERMFTLPQNADVNAVDATIQHGVLRIRVPKTQESKPRRITVRGS